jgi:hypothetical protein
VSCEVRKWFGAVEEINHDGGEPASEPLVKAVVCLQGARAGRPTVDCSRRHGSAAIPALAQYARADRPVTVRERM